MKEKRYEMNDLVSYLQKTLKRRKQTKGNKRVKDQCNWKLKNNRENHKVNSLKILIKLINLLTRLIKKKRKNPQKTNYYGQEKKRDITRDVKGNRKI